MKILEIPQLMFQKFCKSFSLFQHLVCRESHTNAEISENQGMSASKKLGVHLYWNTTFLQNVAYLRGKHSTIPNLFLRG